MVLGAFYSLDVTASIMRKFSPDKPKNEWDPEDDFGLLLEWTNQLDPENLGDYVSENVNVNGSKSKHQKSPSRIRNKTETSKNDTDNNYSTPIIGYDKNHEYRSNEIMNETKKGEFSSLLS